MTASLPIPVALPPLGDRNGRTTLLPTRPATSFSLSVVWSSSDNARRRARASGILLPPARPATLRILRALGTLLLGGDRFHQRVHSEAYVPQAFVSASLRSLVGLLGFHADQCAPGSDRCPTKEFPKPEKGFPRSA